MYLGSARDSVTGSFDEPVKPYTVSITGYRVAPSAQPMLVVGAVLFVLLLMMKGKS